MPKIVKKVGVKSKNLLKMEKVKKLESLKQSTFQDLSKLTGGGNVPSKPVQTGDMRPIYVNGQLVGYSYAPEGPTGICKK
jgi:hypothetical protein